MDGVQAVEGELNAIIKEYLQMLEYKKSVGIFDEETIDKGKEIISDTLPPSQDENQMHIQKKILQAFDNGNNQVFMRLWTENIPEQLQEESSCKRLEFNIQLYFAIIAIKQVPRDQNKIEKGLKGFKSFLETRGAVLSQTTEFVTYYALPFVPASSLTNHPSFSILFEDSWTADLRQKLKDFLSTVLYAAPLPYLYKLFTGSGDRSRTEKAQYENHIQALQQQISEHEYRATLYFKRYTKIQADYKNLINIAAELVDSLENAVRGKMVTPEYLRSICERLFSNSQNPMQSTDFSRPGTAASLLRASVANSKAGLAFGGEVPYLPSLNYIKIKDDLRRLSPRKQALLIQALRLRLTRSQVGEQRDAVISGYIANDILGCASDIKHGETMVKLLMSKDEVLQCQTAMLFNAVASFTAGRAYIGQSEAMMKELIKCLKRESKWKKTGENLLGAMQKLSLRRQVQSVMIEAGIVLWLVMLLEEPEALNDYSLEYSVALLMNLCLRSAGKKECIEDCESILQLLADLLGHENKEIRPYVNGTLYSILALPTIRQRAVSMGLEEVLRCYMQDDDPDTNRQIKFIIKQMNIADKNASDDPVSDNEEEEDDDEEGDVLDIELDEEETQLAKAGELSGEQLLSAKYLGILSSLSTSTVIDQKMSLAASILAEDKPLTRPVTPRSHQKLSAIEEQSSRASARSGLVSQSGRPKTQSSGNAARKAEREPSNPEMPPPRSQRSSRQQSKGKVDPFQAKPKIPRTPDSVGSNRSRPASGDVPLPTRSVSPPVPKPSSRGQDSAECFHDCLKACRNLKRRHFHCKICDYMSERLDNMKRHVPYHFMKLKKERQRAPDGIKMVCHEYFTETCNSDDCSYSQKSHAHLHCTLCKSWACNIKKSYKYRLRHLNRCHYMFFTENENPNEIINDERLSKKIEKLNQADKVRVMTYPAAEVDVLHSRRRRGNTRTNQYQRLQTEQVVIGSNNDEKKVDIDYFENVGNDVRSMIQPLDIGTPQKEDYTPAEHDSSGSGCPEPIINSDVDAKKVLLDGQDKGSTFSITLNGDLSTILAVLLSVKKKGVAVKNQSLREIISRHPSCSANDLPRCLGLINKRKGKKRKGSKRTKKTVRTRKDNFSPDSDSLNNGGSSETNEQPKLPSSNAEVHRTPPEEEPKCVTIETEKILGYLSKMVGIDMDLGTEQLLPDISSDTAMIWEELCSGITTECIDCTDNNAGTEDTPSVRSLNGKRRTKNSRPSKASNPRVKNTKDKIQKSGASVSIGRKKGGQSTRKGVKKGSRKSKKHNVILDSTEVVETSQNKRFTFQTIDINNDILMNKESYEAVNIYDIINGYLRNEDILDINCNNI